MAIESTTDNPAGLRAAYDYIKQMLYDCGKALTIEEFESNGKPSLLAYRSGHRPKKFRVIFNGHLDVVPGKPNQYQAFIKDGKLYGRGAYDMKAAVVILTAVFCEFVDKVPYDLGLQIATDEEIGGMHGTLHQIEQGVLADFVICGECGRSTDVHEIAHEAKGIARFEVGFTGSNAHGAYPWKGDNAAAKAVAFAGTLLERYPIPTQPSQETTASITNMSVQGGAINQIPDNATVAVDARYVAGDPNFTDVERVAELVKEIHPHATITRIDDFSPPLRSNPENPLLLQLKAAAEEIEGASFSLVRRHASSDGRHYGALGGEACEFGIAGEHQHGDDEHITLDAFRHYLKTMRHFLSRTIQSEQPYPVFEDDLAVDVPTPV